MEWRCAWCGKPHEENDPPCDNCGHGEYEKAVVPMAPEGEDDGETITAWVCTECGHEHPKHTPPCDRCGGADLERREMDYDEDEIVAEMLDEGRAGPSADVGYLDVLDAKLVLGFVGVAALIAVLALGYLGYVDVPGIGPDPAPGYADSVDGIALDDVEAAYVAELNDRRAANGYANLTADERVGSAATYYNKQRVRRAYADGERADGRELSQRLGNACTADEVDPLIYNVSSELGQDGGGEFDSAADLARVLVETSHAGEESYANASGGLVGVDVHVAPDGTVFVTQFAC